MNNYDFTAKFRAIYDHAVAQYTKGVRSAAQLLGRICQPPAVTLHACVHACVVRSEGWVWSGTVRS